MPSNSVPGERRATRAEIGDDSIVDPDAVVGLVYADDCGPARIGAGAVIRAFSIIYADVVAGSGLRTGHHVLVREHTQMGDDVLVGTGTVIEGRTVIGNNVKIESGVFIPTDTVIGDRVFIGPRAVLTNDRYPLRRRDEFEPCGPVLEDDVTVGGNATILPGVHIGSGSMVAAGSVVTNDVGPWCLAIGVPAAVWPLAAELREPNRARGSRQT